MAFHAVIRELLWIIIRGTARCLWHTDLAMSPYYGSPAHGPGPRHSVFEMEPSARPPLVLFLSRSNTASSIMAEAILRQLAQGRWRAASAGDAPGGRRVHPVALQTLQRHGVGTHGLRPRLWGEFFGLGREPVRILITLSDVEAARVNWELDNSKLARAAWPMADPGEATGSEADIRQAFEAAFECLARRVGRLLALPAERLAPAALASALQEIAQQP